MKDVKLTYFESTGRAELSRILLAYGGVRYTDERVPRSSFPGLKPQLPYGQLPVLTVDGVTISQSITIARYLAKEVGLTGTTAIHAAQADEMVDAQIDVMNKGVPAFLEQDPEKKQEMMAKHSAEVMEYFTMMEKKLEERGGQFFVANTLTWADIALYAYLDVMSEMTGPEAVAGMLGQCPKITDLRARIGKLPNVEKWIQNRPASAPRT